MFMSNRRRNLRENYFDKIDTEDKAYFLGFLWADGCNLLERNRINIHIHERDYELLKKLNDLIYDQNYIKKLKPSTSIGHFINGKFCRNNGNSISLDINSKYMSSTLNKLGMIPRKSSTVQFPSENVIPSYLIHHFIRGYNDGDGSIMKSHQKKVRFGIKLASSKSFCISLKDLIYKKLGLKFMIYHENKYSVIVISGNYNSKIFCDWIYQDATLYMERKHLKYIELCDNVKNLHRAKYKYIYLNKKNNLWIADVYLGNKKSIRLGCNFETELDAYQFQQNWMNQKN